MQLEPLEDLFGQEPTIEKVRTHHAHGGDQFLLADEVQNEAHES